MIAAVVLPEGRKAYWSSISSSSRAGQIYFLTTTFSRVLDRIGVTEIGRRSQIPVKSLTFFTFGIGVTIACFHLAGNLPESRDWLNKCATISLSSDRYVRSSLGKMAFSVIGPRLWNSLPPDTWNLNYLPIFRSRLETHLFRIALHP